MIGFSETADYDEDKIKFILRRAEDKRAIESKLVALAAWMKESYGGTMIQALRTVLPIKKDVYKRQVLHGFYRNCESVCFSGGRSNGD